MVGVLHCRPASLWPETSLGETLGHRELSKLLGNAFCISCLHGEVVLGAGIHQSAGPLPFGGPEVSPLRARDAA